MSRILKSSYVTMEKNVVIDNTFIPQHIQRENINQEIEQIEETMPDVDMEHVQKVKEEIISEAHIEAERISKDIIAKAEEEAQKIKDISLEEAENIKQQAYDEGFSQGSEDARKQAEQEAENIKQEANLILEKAKEEREETIKALEPEIMNFIIDISQNILTSAFKFNKDIIACLIKKGLEAVKELKNIKIYVSEQNYDYVEEHKNEILQTDANQYNIEIAKDISLDDTDCIIETEIGTIKCGLKEQLEGIKEALYYIL